MKTAIIRQKFLDFFTAKEHAIVPSSPLIPVNDPTLLFTNAGMVQFKEFFLGIEQPKFTKAVSVQRCVRAGGKHNDLENVGYTARHHTFFEMLGNFSFGDYFKREAIQYSWEFITQVLNIPVERLWVTVFRDDKESADIWLNEIGMDPQRFSYCDEKDNFWAMGDTGPCGPCSEIFYDHGPDIPGGPPGSPDSEADRYVEIWNLVFMQYQRTADGELTPLPKPSVDTGMGLERIAAVMQGVHNNYDIDLFQALIQVTAQLASHADLRHPSLKVIADHIRSCAFLIIDGVVPSNEGRGYVLRRIIRRAVRHGHKLGVTEPFFYQLVAPLVLEMGDAYPQLQEHQSQIESVLRREETQFERTLEQGLRLLERDLTTLHGQFIPGETIFKLYDTYGFPVDLTGDIARERGLRLDVAGFEQAMEQQRQQAKAASQFKAEQTPEIVIDHSTEFTGYTTTEQHTPVVAILSEGQLVQQLTAGQAGSMVLASTPFYAESGGQVGDMGVLMTEQATFVVTDTKKLGRVTLHYGTLKTGALSVGDDVSAQVDAAHRQAVMANHSATHLLHAALRQILGKHVVQKGSLVEAKRLRFDFSHHAKLTADELQQIEHLVNQQIRVNDVVQTELMSPEQAKQAGAIAMFGEKYGDEVRVLSMGDFSKELCGGTHVARTGDIGLFMIANESGIASGIRRIEAITGDLALQWCHQIEQQLMQMAELLKTPTETLVSRVKQLLANQRQLEKEVQQLRVKVATVAETDLTQQVQQIHDVAVLVKRFDDMEPKVLRDTLDQLKQKLTDAVIVLVNVKDDKIQVIAGVSKTCLDRLPSAREFVAAICGKGGGRDDMAQGGGSLPADLDARLASIVDIVSKHLSKV